MVLSNAIIFICFCLQAEAQRRLLLSAQSEFIKVYCLVLVEVHERRALLSTGRFIFFF